MKQHRVLESVVVNTPTESYEEVFDDHASISQHLTRVGLDVGRCLIVTDDNVAALYLDDIQAGLEGEKWQPYPISIPPGEASKSSAELGRLYDFFLDRGIDRRTPILALGGGVVGDLAGYCAATILRGVPLVHIPTTLVSQIDSALGGKTGINHSRGKNLIGAFYQPRLVLADIGCLQSLPQRQWIAGLAELVKHALIHSKDLIEECIANWDGLLNRNAGVLRQMIPRSANVKARIVSVDTHERGIRAHLNFGHTVGHALERAAGYGDILHGEAVAVGMAVALSISANRFPDQDFEAARKLLGKLPMSKRPDTVFDDLERAMAVDKKNQGGQRRFVLLSEPGTAIISDDVLPEEIKEAWDLLHA